MPSDLDDIIKRIMGIRAEIDEIGVDISSETNFTLGIDDMRLSYFYGELDTITNILKTLPELKAYKESFILLRTVFEKFLYFWLVLDGQKYRWTKRYTLKLNPGEYEKIEDKRNRKYEEWMKEKKSGKPWFKDAVQIEINTKRNDQIIVTWEYTRFFEENDINETGPIIPAYNFALDQYNPIMAHIPDLSLITKGKPADNSDHVVATHKELYKKFFYIENNLKNLILNGLIDDLQKKKILVHYNFLSAFTHPSKENIKIYAELNHSHYTSPTPYDEDTYS